MKSSSRNIVTKRISSELESISVADSILELIKRKFNTIPEEAIFRIRVSMVEAINNAIIHGNSLNKNKTVTISLFCIKEENAIRIKVEDEGNGFNHKAERKDPTSPAEIEKPNGRGLFLIERLSNRVNFLNNGKTILMDFNC